MQKKKKRIRETYYSIGKIDRWSRKKIKRMYLKEKTDQKPTSPRYVLILPSQPLHVMIQLPVSKRGSR